MDAPLGTQVLISETRRLKTVGAHLFPWQHCLDYCNIPATETLKWSCFLFSAEPGSPAFPLILWTPPYPSSKFWFFFLLQLARVDFWCWQPGTLIGTTGSLNREFQPSLFTKTILTGMSINIWSSSIKCQMVCQGLSSILSNLTLKRIPQDRNYYAIFSN